MPDPISPVSSRDYSWAEQPADREDFREAVVSPREDGIHNICREPSTVLSSAIWVDTTAVSNACRCAKLGSVDEFICDDRNLEKAEKTCLDIAKKAIFKAIELYFGARFSKS